MPGLGETIARLGGVQRGLATARAGATRARPASMRETQGVVPNPGALRMLSYVPNGLPPGAPLVVVLHGCTQTAEAHAAAGGWLELADRLGFAVLAPEQSAANNANRCFNWFEPGDARRDQGEAASIHAMVERCLADHGLDRDRVFVTGLSAGGAMTAVMLATYPETFAGGAVIAGLPYGAARNVQQALSLMHAGQRGSVENLGGHVRTAAPRPAILPRLTVWHGDADHTVNSANGSAVARQWAAARGLSEPDEAEILPGRVRQTWRSPEGEAVVEFNLVKGLGHGTPLATTGEDALGHAAPYMLEAGVSSSMEAARFWGLAPAGPPAAPPTTIAGAEQDREARPTAAAATLGDGVMSAIGGRVPADIQAVISRALKSAGLMS